MASFVVAELATTKGKSKTVMIVNGRVAKSSKVHNAITNGLYEKIFDKIKKELK